MSLPLSKLPPRFQAPVKAALQALTAPSDLDEDLLALSPEPDGDAANDPLHRRMRKPMLLGAATVGLFVVLAGVAACFIQIDGAIMAPGMVRAEYSRRTLRQPSTGVVSAIYVREGQLVKKGQILIQFAPTQPEAMVDVMRNQVYAAQIQSARYEAELMGRPTIQFPAGLVAKAKTDSNLAALMRDQTQVFEARRNLIGQQRSVYQAQIDQLKARIGGLNMQIQANEQSSKLVQEQLAGYQTLYAKGFAPRTVLLNLQRTLSDLGGQRGANIAEVTRTQEQIGEVSFNQAKLLQQVQSEAAEGMRLAQVQLADALPRLRAAEEQLEGATVRSPVDGYVFGLSQHTVGSASVAGERLMDIVPASEPLIIEAHIKPTDVDEAKVGQPARVNLTAYSSRTHSGVDATVVGVSADLYQGEQGPGYFVAQVRVRPQDLAAAGDKDVKLSPGMPATVMLMTGRRSLMNYLLGPFTAPIEKALRES